MAEQRTGGITLRHLPNQFYEKLGIPFVEFLYNGERRGVVASKADLNHLLGEAVSRAGLNIVVAAGFYKESHVPFVRDLDAIADAVRGAKVADKQALEKQGWGVKPCTCTVSKIVPHLTLSIPGSPNFAKFIDFEQAHSYMESRTDGVAALFDGNTAVYLLQAALAVDLPLKIDAEKLVEKLGPMMESLLNTLGINVHFVRL